MIWATFVHATFLPCLNYSGITMRRAQLIYSIIMERYINVRVLISHSINSFTNHGRDMHLGHHSQISLLCEGASVDIAGSLPVPRAGAINAEYIWKLCIRGLEASVGQPSLATVALPRSGVHLLHQSKRCGK